MSDSENHVALGWPLPSYGDDKHAFEAFKNERDYITQNGRLKSTIAAMDWAVREIARLRAVNAEMLAALRLIADWENVRLAGEHAVHLLDVIDAITEVARDAIAKAGAA